MNGAPSYFSEEAYDQRLADFLALFDRTPPGVVRHVAPADLNNPKTQGQVDEAKRNILKLMAIGGLAAVAGGGAVAGALQYAQPPLKGLASYPTVQLFYSDGSAVTVDNVASHINPDSNELTLYNYPLTNEPNFLLYLGSPAPNGIGPNNGVVSYSAICQHLGCVPPFISYYPAGKCGNFNNGRAIIHCICHGSTYDPFVSQTSDGGGAAILTGPTVLPIPQTLLKTDAQGNIYAYSMIGPPVKDHFTSLTGGTGVSGRSQASNLTPSNQQCPA
ncbi:Rieske iron sulfur protein [mine drainage metagenome]|uniref:Rieske iron sulfur protein n=2 Tax=mine drainage metagenome TaxID=410659 RepID=T0Y6T4_9ZZZZ